MHRTDAIDLVLSSLRDFLPPSGDAPPPVLDASTPLVGPHAVLDSLGLVELIVDVEQRLQLEHGVAVTLADERAMSMRHSPYRTVATLAEYVCAVTTEQPDDAGA